MRRSPRQSGRCQPGPPARCAEAPARNSIRCGAPVRRAVGHQSRAGPGVPFFFRWALIDQSGVTMSIAGSAGARRPGKQVPDAGIARKARLKPSAADAGRCGLFEAQQPCDMRQTAQVVVRAAGSGKDTQGGTGEVVRGRSVRWSPVHVLLRRARGEHGPSRRAAGRPRAGTAAPGGARSLNVVEERRCQGDRGRGRPAGRIPCWRSWTRTVRPGKLGGEGQPGRRVRASTQFGRGAPRRAQRRAAQPGTLPRKRRAF